MRVGGEADSRFIMAHSNNNLDVLTVYRFRPQPFSYHLFCMQLLNHVANAMQRAEGFVLERALVLYVLYVFHCSPVQLHKCNSTTVNREYFVSKIFLAIIFRVK